MEKKIRSRKPEQNKNIFTEGIDYSKTGRASIWGSDDKATSELLERVKIHGRWLNFAAGDGRYNLNLLRKADFVIASDIDESALYKLWKNTPQKFRTKLQIKAFDITKKFPFGNDSFDGVFCTGTLHIFSRKVLRNVIAEVNRVLKPRGRVILDFAADIKRIRLDGKSYVIKHEPKYSLAEAKRVLEYLFKKYKVKMYESEVPEEILKNANPPYTFSCKFLLLVADKK